MVDTDALRLIALRMFDQGNAEAFHTLETAADEIEALRKGDGYAKAIEDSAKVASLYIIEKNSIHPDIGFDGMSEQAKMIAHTTCQYVAEAIRALAGKDAEV